MVDSIEAFVDKLHQEGVATARQEADQIISQAKQQAEQIVNEANDQAATIIDNAKREGEKAEARAQTELDLACRNALNQLQHTLNQAMQGTIRQAVEQKLGDGEFLADLIKQVVGAYAQADAAGQKVELDVPEDQLEALRDRALKELNDAIGSGSTLDMTGKLSKAGFEYSFGEGTVEVSTDSVMAILSDMVSLKLRQKVLDAAQGTDGAQE